MLSIPFFRIQTVLFFSLTMLMSAPLWAQKKTDKKQKEEKTIAALTKEMIQDEGLITTYFSEDEKLFFALPDSLLNEPLLMVTRFSKFPSGYGGYTVAGSKTSEQVLFFEKKGKKIYLRQQSYTNNATAASAIAKSVEVNNYPPILAAFDIKNETEKNISLIDVTSYFMNDSPGFNIISKTYKDNYKMGGVDKKRSRIDTVKSFPQNTEVRHTLTYAAQKLSRGDNSKTLSFQVNHSIIALPKHPMRPRKVDNRVGWFSLQKNNFSNPNALKVEDYSIVKRWRLEPKDEAAYMRGELVEPKKPIVYFLDPATPKKWRPYFKQGVEDWNAAFEKAGFKNAIQAKNPPTPEEDPDFSPEDIRYSTVRYVASTTRNAMGPSVADPRTGEILESDIIWYHNHLRSYRNRYLLETGAANPKARTLQTPEAEIGEMIRQVIAHEVGHTLGLPHNMRASAAYPVDSLRYGSFTQKMGIAASIMDYARYNYVAQPGDKNIRFVRQLGPYDMYSIEWGYRYFPEGQAQEEQNFLTNFVDERSLDPRYRFGSYGDPNSQTENIGDDPVKASTYGLKNLKIVASNLEAWTSENGKPYDDLKELHGELLGVYRRYIYHVLNIIGGVNRTLMVKGQEDIPYQNVPRAAQLTALNFLNANFWQPQPWLFPKSIVSNIQVSGMLSRIVDMQKAGLYRILSDRTLNRMLSQETTLVGSPLSVRELLQRLESQLINEVKQPSLLQRELQKNYLERLVDLIANDKLQPEIKAQLLAQKKVLTSHFKRLKNKGDTAHKQHAAYCVFLLEE